MTREKIIQGLRALVAASLVVFCFGAAGEICGAFFETTAAAFDAKFPDNKADDIRAALAKLGQPQATAGTENSLGRPIAVMVVDEDPRAIVAWDVASGAQLWKATPPVQSELTTAGDLVIFQSGFEVTALDIKTGKELWQIEIEEGWDFHGADVTGNMAVVSVGVGGHEAGAYSTGRLIAVKASSGGTKWDISSGGGLLGTPSIYNGLVFVPWDRQKVVIIDADEGEEICRLRADDYTINFVEAGPAGAYYGAAPTGTALTTLFRFDEKSVAGTREGSSNFMPTLEPVPGDPSFERDAFALPVAGRSAGEKIRFHWVPMADPAAPITLSDNIYYLHYWRYIVAFDRATDQVRWIHRSAKDVESMDAVSGGAMGVDSDGRLFFVDSASGTEIWSQDIGAKVFTASFDVEGFRPSGGGGAAADPLIGLKELIWDKDNRMLPIRSYAAFLMAAFPAPEVTGDLLAIYSDASIPKGLRDAVVQALRKRTTGAQYLVEALHMRYDFLEQTQAPPMGVVAPALVNMQERSAVPGLLSHLMNHETAVEDLREIALAIHELGDPSVVGTLTQLITLYHADSSFISHEDALAMAARGILKYGGQGGEKMVADIRDDPQTLPELKTQLLEILDPEAAAKAAAEKAAAEAAAKTAADEAATEAAADEVAAEEASRPRAITRDQINQTISENQAVLKPCVQEALGKMPNLTQIRLKFMITGETGQASGLQILPANVPGLQQCLANGLAAIPFPKFKNLRQS
ncbi:MAG: PQQ-binding-like beta-propeller repeat protein, partial [Deltaproteobacteria bacterium]|nr:PQQ-binding-like beta-propeller repeat protein [Deltaproteobacteria bacterium]